MWIESLQPFRHWRSAHAYPQALTFKQIHRKLYGNEFYYSGRIETCKNIKIFEVDIFRIAVLYDM
jgi:hypothetical protein